MSLNFNYSRCKDSDQLVDPTDPEKIHPVTYAIIWNMMAIDMNGITADNVDEVWFRTALQSLVTDSCAASYGHGSSDHVRIYLTRADIERHVGLSTNVSTMTRKQWINKCFGSPNSINWIASRSQRKSAMEMVADYAETVRLNKQLEEMEVIER